MKKKQIHIECHNNYILKPVLRMNNGYVRFNYKYPDACMQKAIRGKNKDSDEERDPYLLL